MFPLLMKGAGTTMATRGQNMPYTTGHSRYFSIIYTDLTYVPRVFLDLDNTLNAPAFTTVCLTARKDGLTAYVDRNLITLGMFPSGLWDEDLTLDILSDLMAAGTDMHTDEQTNLMAAGTDIHTDKQTVGPQVTVTRSMLFL